MPSPEIQCNPDNHHFDVTELTVTRGTEIKFKLTHGNASFVVEVLKGSPLTRTDELFGSETFTVNNSTTWTPKTVQQGAQDITYTIQRVIPPGAEGRGHYDGMTGTITVSPGPTPR